MCVQVMDFVQPLLAYHFYCLVFFMSGKHLKFQVGASPMSFQCCGKLELAVFLELLY